jgi:hypothetical protein
VYHVMNSQVRRIADNEAREKCKYKVAH